MTDFIPDLDDPRTRGWGGSTLNEESGNWRHTRNWLSSTLLGFLSIAYVASFALTIAIPLWLAFGLYQLYRDYRIFRINSDPRTPAVVCEPQGLTIHDGQRRIEWQWQWRDLDSVLYDGDYLLISLRGGGTVEYHKRHLTDADYYDIAAAASAYLNGNAPPARRFLPPQINHTWYEPHNPFDRALIHFGPLFLALTILWPAPLGPSTLWPRIMALESPYGTRLLVLIMVVSASLTLISLYILANNYREHYYHGGISKGLGMDDNGLHIFTTSGQSIVSTPFSLSWADIARSNIETKTYRGITHYSLHITDRLSNRCTLIPDYLRGGENTIREIAAAIDAIIQQRPLPPLAADSNTFISIPLVIRGLFWLNALCTTAAIVVAARCLYLNVCIIPKEQLPLLAYACAALAVAAFLIDLTYRLSKGQRL